MPFALGAGQKVGSNYQVELTFALANKQREKVFVMAKEVVLEPHSDNEIKAKVPRSHPIFRALVQDGVSRFRASDSEPWITLADARPSIEALLRDCK
jgi:hypothetical protein